MKQQVNLYQAEFRKSRNWTQTGAIAAVIAIVTIYSTISGYQVYLLDDMQATLAQKNAQLNALKQSHDILKANIKPRARDMELSISIDAITRSNKNKQRALAFLSGDDSGNTTGFSYLLTTLGKKRDSIEQIWFRQIRLSDGGFHMELLGNSYQPEQLPEFIENLGDDDIYRQREFRKLSIVSARDKTRLSEFELGTQDAAGEPGDSHTSRVEFMNRLKYLARMDDGMQSP